MPTSHVTALTNVGTFFLANTPSSRAFGAFYLDALRAQTARNPRENDQMFFNKMVQRHARNFRFHATYLDPTLFVSGYRYYEQLDTLWPVASVSEAQQRLYAPLMPATHAHLGSRLAELADADLNTADATAYAERLRRAHVRFDRIVAVHHNWIGGDAAKWDRAFEWNVRSPQPLSHVAAPSMRRACVRAKTAAPLTWNDAERVVRAVRCIFCAGARPARAELGELHQPDAWHAAYKSALRLEALERAAAPPRQDQS
jgi:hypothetical protein